MEEILNLLNQEKCAGNTTCLCIVIKTHGSVPRHAGSKMIVYPDGRTVGSVGGGEVEAIVISAALEAIRSQKPQVLEYTFDSKDVEKENFCKGKMWLYMEPQLSKPLILVVGAGHIGRNVAKFAKALNYRVAVCDSRPELLNPEFFPGVDQILNINAIEIPHKLVIDQHTYVVMVTKSSEEDIEGIPGILERSPAYVGVIGSRYRWEKTLQGLVAKGVAEEALKSIRSPIGIDIQAETPDEIAISIIAEIIQIKNSRSASPEHRDRSDYVEALQNS